MKNQESTSNRCPYDDLIELLCLDVQLSEGEKSKARIHLQQCELCRKNFEELENTYSNLNEEVHQPVTNKALDLAKQIRNKETKYGLVVCEPVKAKKKVKKVAASYKTKVVFTANGTGAASDKKLADFDLRSFPQDSIAIRAMTDKACDKLLLYLWHSNGDDAGGWELKLGKSQTAVFSRAGVSQIPLMEIEDLGDKVIYFKEKHKKTSASENRFVSIFESISSQ